MKTAHNTAPAASSLDVSRGFDFWGTNTGTDFLNNKVYATGVAVDVFTNSLIGPQSHKGNEWHPVIVPPLVRGCAPYQIS